MPTYEYRCSDCTNSFEIVQKFSDASLTSCPECDGSLRKVFSPVGVVFKGSGFYATDNRTKGSSTIAATGEKKDAAAPKAAESASPTPAASQPAAAAATSAA